MFSIVCVYNDKKSYQKNLLASLKKQNTFYDLIALNNTKKRFSSAAEGLNYGAEKAKGNYIIFIHQDVFLKEANWLKKAEKIISKTNNLDIAGVAGLDFQNKRLGFIDDAGSIWGKPFKKPRISQTLDECLLIIPADVFKKQKFDEKNFNGWHLYGVDYALAVKKLSLKTYVLPLYVQHQSPKKNIKNLFKYQKRVFEKHRNNHKYICTTTGFLSRLTLDLKSKLPNNRVVEFFWGIAGISPVGKLYQNLIKRIWNKIS